MEHRDGATCLIVRDGKILMTKNQREHVYFSLPGGAIEEGETPEDAAIRELFEECGVRGTIIRKLSTYHMPLDEGVTIHSFLVDIGEQTPVLGHDPTDLDECQTLVGLEWKYFHEVSQRDRMFLVMLGIMGVREFLNEIQGWDDSDNYPPPRQTKNE
ncbi:MAG: NUDIX domain-containing protein [Defluviitaleaceae bacterium]|nr:NUDIX domain-containing protein [Defluviitaleaceae bacterium]